MHAIALASTRAGSRDRIEDDYAYGAYVLEIYRLATPSTVFAVPSTDFRMASQPCGGAGGVQILEIPSYVRGYHAYKDTWEPRIGEQLLLKREQDNCHDASAVAVFKECAVVGHVPARLGPLFSAFLARDFNKGFCEIVGGPVNRGGGYGMEIPCVYKLYGAKKYIEWLQALLDSFLYDINA